MFEKIQEYDKMQILIDEYRLKIKDKDTKIKLLQEILFEMQDLEIEAIHK